MFRNTIVAVLALCVWALSFYAPLGPVARGLNAPPTEFSAARAQAILSRLAGDQAPHPVGTPAQAAVQERLQAELQALGIKSTRLDRMSCYGTQREHGVGCAQVHDIIAEVSPGEGKAILMMAHTDSVAAGPGAGDDLSGVATILESIRALKTDGALRRPILALFSDGEEVNMLGAAAFANDPAWMQRVGVVVNAEARGNTGPSYLFQVSDHNAGLVEAYARGVTHYAASSLYGEIYRFLPNDTDLTPFLERGVPGMNFAFIGNVAHYHTPLDRVENLSPASLQSHGENVLGTTRMLANKDAALAGGNAIYLDILGRVLPRLPASFALPLALLEVLVLGLAAWMGRRDDRPVLRGWRIVSALAPILTLLCCVAMGYALHEMAVLVSGVPNPSFAHPLAMRLSLGLGMVTVALLAARLEAGASIAWLWMAGFGVLAAIFAPGLSPYFIFPTLVAAIALGATARMDGPARQAALWASALVGAIVWLGFAASGEAIAGLVLHPLFTVPVGFAIIALLPLLDGDTSRLVSTIGLGLALLAAVVAGFTRPFSPAAPERLNIRYVENDGRGFWVADPAILPRRLARAGHFSVQVHVDPVGARGHIGSAGESLYPPPDVTVGKSGNDVNLILKGSAQATGMLLVLPPKVSLTRLSINGIAMTTPPEASRIACSGRECATANIRFTLDTSRATREGSGGLTLVEIRDGLPPKGAELLKLRPPIAVPSGAGDRTMLVNHISLE